MEPSFPQFSLLPAELRCKIWRLATPPRIVRARIKLDLEAWNNATEADWMDVHYRVVFDGQAPPLPLLVLVSHEARHEILESYRNPLQISGVALRQALGAQSVDDTALDTMCDSSRILRFNPECDVLEWMEPRRWVDIFRKPSPLFLAACLSSVRHVSVEYHSRISTELDLLSLAVLDQDQPLKTLTMLSLHSIENRPLDYRCLRYRLAKRSSGPEAILGEEGTAGDVQHILSRHPTCFLTLSQRTQGDGYGGFLHKAHPLINELLARGIRPRGMLLEAETELSSKFAIYEAFDPSDLADEEYISWRVSYNIVVFVFEYDGNFEYAQTD
ncbi:uncharacterized protein GGS25DRAFT_524187 [Hypoxylon fragiforme]|uniref:uncharacterized protein n=1 Tax=Hypoxylon fragiforme TaxID=63214 RepID=UPI0020C5D92D|nr:uncharacterized protein GGS25DRAFT_524187 [Hypoxylon fragiforme]KAI2606522.1 hypothetical protein GGS25DRAFT_524187 [Hypoxylon fragiforme]